MSDAPIGAATGGADGEHLALSALMRILAALNVGEFVVDADHRFVAVSDACTRWLPHLNTAVVGRPVERAVTGDLAPAVSAMVDRLAADGGPALTIGDAVIGATAARGELRIRLLGVADRGGDGSLVCARFVALVFDAPKVTEVAPPLSPERAAALRIAHRYELGERNRELLELLASGHRVPTIARTLHLAQGTVRNRISRWAMPSVSTARPASSASSSRRRRRP